MSRLHKLHLIITACGLIGWLALSATDADASEARMTSLGHNPMVVDDDNVVVYPGMLPVFGNTGFVNLYPGSPWGNAGVFIGEKIVFGAWVHRESLYDDFEMTKDTLSMNLPTTHDLFDLYLGTPVGFGLRLTLTSGLDSIETKNVTDDKKRYSDGSSAFGVDLMPGYSFDVDGYHGDFGAGITLNHYVIAIDGVEEFTTGWIPSFLLRHRSIIGRAEEFLGWVVDLTLTRRAYTAKSQEMDAGYGHWMMQFVGGPRFQFPNNFTVWAGLTVDFEHITGEIDGVKQPKLMGIGAPGINLCGELVLWDLLTVRAGVVYDTYWTIKKTPNPLDDTQISSVQRSMGQRFSWQTGIGLTLGAFQIDGTVSQSLYFNGPQFIGGGSPGLFGMLSAAYVWH